MDTHVRVQDHNAQAVTPKMRRRSQLIRRLIGLRRQRNELFPEAVAGDASWVMLVELYLAAMEQRTESISSLCVASGVPSTTALRYIKTMTDAGTIIREDDPGDGRRVFVYLAPDGLQRIEQLFDEMESHFDLSRRD